MRWSDRPTERVQAPLALLVAFTQPCSVCAYLGKLPFLAVCRYFVRFSAKCACSDLVIHRLSYALSPGTLRCFRSFAIKCMDRHLESTRHALENAMMQFF